jgi:ApbE superfamily uncharacterized protein (UPF0280 family)
VKIYANREIYRGVVSPTDLIPFRVIIRETDLMVLADRDLSREAYEITLRHRLALEDHLRRHPEFGESFAPLPEVPGEPGIVRLMREAAAAAGVGPMAAVAGAVAECVGGELRSLSATVIVENGGDLYLCSAKERVVGIYAGAGPGDFDLGLRLKGPVSPSGIATSSGVIGPSFSGGQARAATVVARSAALADAAATALGNRLRAAGDIQPALEWLAAIPGVTGAVAMLGKTLGAWGAVDLVQLNPEGKS